jgi:hypothetical protein
MTGPVFCAECGGITHAYWWYWSARGDTRTPLCDGHAADKDLSYLTEIGRQP